MKRKAKNKIDLSVVMEVGMLKETEKAIMINYRSSGYWVQKWLPKSQVCILETGSKISFVQQYSNAKFDSYGRMQNCKVTTTAINKSAKISIPKWIYTADMSNGYDI